MSEHSSPLATSVPAASCDCDLQIPPSLEVHLTPQKQLAVSMIRLKYAHDIAQLAAAALDEVADLVKDVRTPC